MFRNPALFVVLLAIAAHVSQAEAQRAAWDEMSRRVDVLLEERIDAEQSPVAAPTTDAEFIRRASLDLTGVIPRVADVRAFLADQDADKRTRLIDELLRSPRHATHMAHTWRQIMLPGGVDLEQLPSVSGVQNWLRRRFAANLRYDRIVADFLNAQGGGESGPALFYTALELKPEKLAASTSRIFLGLQIECAECHQHPFDKWTQDDFWGYAAFFARLGQNSMTAGSMALIDASEGEVTLPETDVVVLPKYPDGRRPREEARGTRRGQLAIWMSSRDNPFLARAAVNRFWAHLFGRGLVEPVDDFGPHNPPSHPQLLSELTDFFIRSEFDVQVLLRVLADTQAYQRSSRIEGPVPADALFARMPMKTLSADQLFDSLERIFSQPGEAPSILPGAQGPFDPRRLAFAAKMQLRGANATEFDAGVLQALSLLNGIETERLTDPARSGLLQGVTAPWMNNAERLEVLFLATLSRPPAEEERAELLPYLETATDEAARDVITSDILWALLNSAEFCLNH